MQDWCNNKTCCLGRLFHLCVMVLLLTGVISGCSSSKKKEESAVESTATVPAKAPEVDNRLAEAASKVKSQAKQDFDKALVAMKAGENAKAEALLRKVATQHPDLSGPYVNLGLIKFSDGKLEDAEEQFKKALSINPRSAISYNHMGIIYRGKGEFKEARRYYEMALDVDPDYANAHLNYGILLDLYLGELDKALEHYEKFQDLSDSEDKTVNKWIADLKNRIKRKNK